MFKWFWTIFSLGAPDMRSHVVPTIDKSPDQICLHVGAPRDVPDATIDLTSEVENASESEIGKD